MGLSKTTVIHGAVRLEFQLRIAHSPVAENHSSIPKKRNAVCAYVRLRLRESCAMSSGKERIAIPATESDMA